MDTITGKTEPVLIIEAPVRHGKSEFISKWVSSWYLGRHPDRFVLLASATGRLAEKWGRRARSIVEESGPEMFGVGVSETRRSAGDWETTQGGGMVTAGVGGDVMGRDGHLLIVDDYLKTSEDALSETIRDKQWDWWQSTFSTRMEPGACAIVMATRWHKDDLIGRLTGESSEVDADSLMPARRLRLPAIAEEDDPLGRQVGEALWPERWPVGLPTEKVDNAWGHPVIGLAMRKRSIDPFWWLALYQQRPSRHGRTEWPETYFEDVWADRWPDHFELSAVALDPSKGKKRGDYSAFVFAGLSGGCLWVDADIDRRDVNKIVQAGIEINQQLRPDAFGIEANAWQDLLEREFIRAASELNIMPPDIQLLDNRVSKELRISRLGPWMARKQIKIRPTPGGKLLVRQLQEFPLADHDDGPDALEMAIRLLNWLSGQTVSDGEEIALA